MVIGIDKFQFVELTLNWQRPLTSCRRSYFVARLFDFELSLLGRKHFAENIIDGVGVSALCYQAVLQTDK